VDWLNEAADAADAVVLNPAAYGHTSIALHDAIRAMDVPVVECHLSNPAAREGFRHVSLTAPAARGVISGFGALSYELALDAACALLSAPAR
jgi:3-dehydroquinate dehydratase-2